MFAAVVTSFIVLFELKELELRTPGRLSLQMLQGIYALRGARFCMAG
jgi:hypothetical protein